MKSIFIQITSYHDHELYKTVRNAIDTSSGQTHINFGINCVYNTYNDLNLSFNANVSLHISKAPDNLGMGLGRSIAHSFYKGEDYYFQVDAHSRFDRNWDLSLINDINNYKLQGFNKPLITNYPKPFWYEGDKETFRTHEEVVTQFYWKHKDRFSLYRTPMQGTYLNPAGNVQSLSVSGGCIFTEGEFLKPNTKIFADGEEIFIAARAFTSGYDLMVPSQTFMYHLYYGDEGLNKRRLVPPDFPEETSILESISKTEIYETLSGSGSIGEYRLGTVRSLQDYGNYSGLDFYNGEVLRNGPEVLP